MVPMGTEHRLRVAHKRERTDLSPNYKESSGILVLILVITIVRYVAGRLYGAGYAYDGLRPTRSCSRCVVRTRRRTRSFEGSKVSVLGAVVRIVRMSSSWVERVE